MSVRFQHLTKLLLWVCATIQAGLLVLADVLAEMRVSYFMIACKGTALSLVVMIQNVKLEEPADCTWYACWHVGIPFWARWRILYDLETLLQRESSC